MALDTPTWLQNGTYSARLDRIFADILFTEGVMRVGLGDLLVTQRGAGANNSVDIAAGRACITGDDSADQGNYLIRNRATVNLAATAAPVANSRIDLVCLRVNDSAAGGPAGDDAQFVYVTGVAAPVPAIPATPTTAIVLARVLRTVGDTQVVNANITDVRTQSLTVFSNTLTNAGDLLSYDGANLIRVGLGVNGYPLIGGATSVGYGQVGTVGIADGAVTTPKIADLNVTTAKIADLNVTTGKLADSSVTSAKIANATIVGADIAASTITGSNIANGTVTGTNIGALTITGANIAAATIDGSKIVANTIQDGNILASTITGGKIAATTITNGNVANATLTGSKIADEAFLTYAPIVSGINTNGGPVSGRYHKMGNLVFFHIDLELGAPGWTITAPIVLATPTNAVASWQHLYNAQIVDVPGTWYPAETRYQTVGSFALGAVRVFGQPYIDFNISATMPFSFATGDRFFVSGWYEEA